MKKATELRYDLFVESDGISEDALEEEMIDLSMALSNEDLIDIPGVWPLVSEFLLDRARDSILANRRADREEEERDREELRRAYAPPVEA